MVGIIHPFSISTRDLPHLPLYELTWIAWNHYRGEKEHFQKCVVCKNIGEWCLDLIWKKWQHKKFVIYNEFIYDLLYTDMYDSWMNATPSCDLNHMNAFFLGLKLFFKKYIIVN